MATPTNGGFTVETSLYDAVWEASKTSKAGKDLWRLYNALADEVEGEELLSRLDAYVSDLDADAQALYRTLAK
jgi:hypothetical protein